ncbi:MAG TPA: FAD-binding oxidoreductase [Chitinophagaceae bacterium]|nr:FAD-binding oxidoreductase [Chitinophagaceae bacterium]
MALQPWRKGIVTRIENETTDTRRFWIEVPELDVFDFIPGQFVTFDLPIHEKPTRRWRSYSIASWPDGTNCFELIIVLDRQGLGTPYLFNEVQVGSELTFRGPQGVFTLREPIERDLFLICTGTGVAPFRSMLHHIRNRMIPHREIYLIFGTRTRADILYYEELKAMEKEIAGYHYIVTLSREEWEGPTGYVHPLYESLCRERREAEFLLCGWKPMIDEAKTRIRAMGYDKKLIREELYG